MCATDHIKNLKTESLFVVVVKSSPQDMFIDFHREDEGVRGETEREREREREGNIGVRNINRLPPLRAPAGDALQARCVP